MDSGPAWDETTDVMMLRVYAQMVMDARSEKMFKASLQLLVEELERSSYNYLGGQEK